MIRSPIALALLLFPVPALAQSETLRPVADASISQAEPGTNAGSEDSLLVRRHRKGSYRTFLRFDVDPAAADAARAAVLRLYCTDASSAGGTLYSQVDDGWTEDGITWRTQPLTTLTQVGPLGSVGTNKWVEIDVTRAVRGGAHVFAIEGTSANGAAYSSREGRHPPELVVTADGSGGGEEPDPPVAAFTGAPLSGQVPLQTAFADASTGTVTTWLWEFGDGTTSTARNPAHTYSAPGTYSVTLTVSGPDGTDDLRRGDYVLVLPADPAPEPPVAAFTGAPLSGQAPLQTVFTDASTGAVTAWLWSFGDGTSSTAQSPVHTYSAAGNYSVTLTVSGPDGTDELRRTDYVRVLADDVRGIWTSPIELEGLSTSGTAWRNLLDEANRSVGTPLVSDQDDDTDVRVLAKALVYARTGTESYRTQVIDACRKAIGTEVGGRSLALGRNLIGFVIAADLVGLTGADETAFRDWLRRCLAEDLDGMTLRECHERRPNNWGTHAGASRVAVAAYLGDANELARCAQVFRGWLGDRSAYAGFSFGELDWQADRSRPVAVNPRGATRDGHSIDGVLPDDQRRAGGFTWPPPKENYVWEALQGAIAQAVILDRAGYHDVWMWSDQALLRAVRWLHQQCNYPASGDDDWQPHVVNFFYGSDYPAPSPTHPGKNVGWTDWTHPKR